MGEGGQGPGVVNIDIPLSTFILSIQIIAFVFIEHAINTPDNVEAVNPIWAVSS